MTQKTETKERDDEIERSVDNELDVDYSPDEALATLSDRAEHRLQMQEIKRRTVRPGLMRLNVKRVVSAENSEQWAIDLEHPAYAEDDFIRIFAEKPMHGWSTDYKIVRMLEWYGITSQDPHELEFEQIYVEKDDEKSDYAHGWRVVQPPEYSPPKVRGAKRTLSRIKNDYHPARTNAKMWLTLLAGVLLGPVVASMLPAVLGTVGTIMAVSALLYVAATIFGMAVMDPED